MSKLYWSIYGEQCGVVWRGVVYYCGVVLRGTYRLEGGGDPIVGGGPHTRNLLGAQHGEAAPSTALLLALVLPLDDVHCRGDTWVRQHVTGDLKHSDHDLSNTDQ